MSLRDCAFKYRKMIKAEVTKLGRVGTIQTRVVATISASTVAAGIGASNVIGSLYRDLLRQNGLAAVIILVAVIVGLLSCCLSLGVCYYRRRAA